MKKLFILLFFVGFSLTLFYSCAEDQNFEQFNDLSIEPTVASSIFYFESDQATINAAGTGGFYTQNFTFQAFNESFVAENVLDGVITYQVENTTTKDLQIIVEFLDEGGNVLDIESFTIEPAPAPLIERQIIYGNGGRSLDILINTTNIRVSGENLGDDTSTSSLPEPRILLRSSAEFRLKLR